MIKNLALSMHITLFLMLFISFDSSQALGEEKLKERFQFFEKNYVRIIFVNMDIPASATKKLRTFVNRGYNIVLYNNHPNKWTDAEMLLLSEALESLQTPIKVAYWDASGDKNLFNNLAEKLLVEQIMIDQVNSFVVGLSDEDISLAQANGLMFYDQRDFFDPHNCEDRLH